MWPRRKSRIKVESIKRQTQERGLAQAKAGSHRGRVLRMPPKTEQLPEGLCQKRVSWGAAAGKGNLELRLSVPGILATSGREQTLR